MILTKRYKVIQQFSLFQKFKLRKKLLSPLRWKSTPNHLPKRLKRKKRMTTKGKRRSSQDKLSIMTIRSTTMFQMPTTSLWICLIEKSVVHHPSFLGATKEIQTSNFEPTQHCDRSENTLTRFLKAEFFSKLVLTKIL